MKKKLGNWLGGYCFRFSPSGGSMPVDQIFGAHDAATEKEIMEGKAKLDKVTSLLLGHTGWIGGLVGKGEISSVSLFTHGTWIT
eukprot:9628155-Ditylum_brightwellii.AAC.1